MRSPTFSSWSKAQVAGQAARAAHPPAGLSLGGFVRPDDGRFVGHLEAVGHVAGERDVEHRRAHAAVLDDVLDGRDQIARAPGEGAARFEDQPQVGVARPELAQQGDQLIAVVVGVRHQVAAAHVEPLDAVEQVAEALLDGLKGQPQVLGARFAEDVEMESLDALGEFAQLFGRDAQTRAGDARVVEVGLDGRIARVDPQTARDAVDQGPLSEAFELGEGVEGDVVAAAQDLVEVAVGIDRGIGMGRSAELFEDEPGLGVGMLRQLGKNAPHGAGLQCDDDLGARLAPYAVDQGQIRIEQRLVEHIARGRQFQKVNHRWEVPFKNRDKCNNFIAIRTPAWRGKSRGARRNRYLYLPLGHPLRGGNGNGDGDSVAVARKRAVKAYYRAMQMLTRFSTAVENGCSVSPL